MCPRAECALVYFLVNSFLRIYIQEEQVFTMLCPFPVPAHFQGLGVKAKLHFLNLVGPEILIGWLNLPSLALHLTWASLSLAQLPRIFPNKLPACWSLSQILFHKEPSGNAVCPGGSEVIGGKGLRQFAVFFNQGLGNIGKLVRNSEPLHFWFTGWVVKGCSPMKVVY